MRSTTLLLTLLATFALPLPALAQAKDSPTDEPVSATTLTAAEDATSAESDTRTLAAASTIEPPAETWDVTNVEELPSRTYMFAGIRYRGNVIPGFLLGLFLDEGQTIYTNLAGIEFDIRKDGFSLVPALSLHELGTRDILFKQKNTPDIPGNYAIVNSGMKVIYASVDLLWSAKLHKNVEFEYGAGFGLGVVFGELVNNWAQESPDGPFVSSSNRHFKRCQTVLPPGVGCNRADHQNAAVDKVGGYTEPSWLDGGSKPVLFPWIAVPQLGLRIKPVKNFVGRIGVGFALTGFWFGFNAQYGFEQKPKD
jgi:hypothetical protein